MLHVVVPYFSMQSFEMGHVEQKSAVALKTNTNSGELITTTLNLPCSLDTVLSLV